MTINLLTGIGHTLSLTIGYALVGGLIKYIDQAYDIDIFNKKLATLLAIPTAILMGLLMAFNDSSATIFFAIVLGVALTKKIDNLAFQIGLFFLIMVPIFFGDYVKVQWLPFALLLMAGLADEYTSDWSDEKIKKRVYGEALGKKTQTQTQQKILETIFQHRIIMKLVVLTLVIARIFQPIYIIAFLAFDLSYKAVEIYSIQLKKYSINRQLKPNHKTAKTAV